MKTSCAGCRPRRCRDCGAAGSSTSFMRCCCRVGRYSISSGSRTGALPWGVHGMFNVEAPVSTTRVGRRAYTVTRIDNVLHDPEAVTALALGQTYHQDPGNFYPGIRAVVPKFFG